MKIQRIVNPIAMKILILLKMTSIFSSSIQVVPGLKFKTELIRLLSPYRPFS